MDDHSHEPDPDKRVTSPMQRFGSREVGIGAAVLLVGLLVAYVIPFLFTSERRRRSRFNSHREQPTATRLPRVPGQRVIGR